MRRCLLDMDGVICDWHKGIAEHHGVSTEWKAINNHLVHPGLGIKDEELWEGCDRDFWKNLEPTPDAERIINLVTWYFDWDDICVLTLFPVKYGYPLEMVEECLLGKLDWLEKYFPRLLTHFLIGPSKRFCVSPESYLFDDQNNNVEEFDNLGGHGILIPRLWNKYHDKDFSFVETQLEKKLCN